MQYVFLHVSNVGYVKGLLLAPTEEAHIPVQIDEFLLEAPRPLVIFVVETMPMKSH
jgi:hypothetical protein